MPKYRCLGDQAVDTLATMRVREGLNGLKPRAAAGASQPEAAAPPHGRAYRGGALDGHPGPW